MDFEQVPTQWPVPVELMIGGLGALLAGSIGLWLWLALRRRPAPVKPPPVQPEVDIARLDMVPPDAFADSRLELYGTPVRVGVLVLAPVGRDGRRPQAEEVPELLDQLLPGLADVVSHDQPLLRLWNAQMSSQGFVHAFSNRLPLPGDRGKGSRWCSVAGKFTAFSHQYLAGVILQSEKENALSQYVVQHEGQWHDLLRMR
ncbi:MAG: hypothetical protein AB7F89_05980 [Pirellulaceae bacterium]